MSNVNLNSGYGRAMIDNLYTIGKVQNRLLIVCDGSTGANYDMLADLARVDESGRVRLFTTMSAAVTELQDFDTILVMPGSHSVAAVLTITESYVRILGSSGHSNVAAVDTYLEATGSNNILDLQGSGIEVGHLGFLPAEGYWAIDTVATVDPAGWWIHHNYFYATEQGSCYGTRIGRRDDSNGNAISAVVEDNYYFKCGTTALHLDGSRAAARRNTFVLMHTASAGGGIVNPQSGSQRNSNEIVDNIFIAYGTPCDAKGINFSGASVPTVGTMWVDGNRFINFSSATNACNRLSGYGGRNWYNDQFLTDANPPVATNWYA